MKLEIALKVLARVLSAANCSLLSRYFLSYLHQASQNNIVRETGSQNFGFDLHRMTILLSLNSI